MLATANQPTRAGAVAFAQPTTPFSGGLPLSPSGLATNQDLVLAAVPEPSAVALAGLGGALLLLLRHRRTASKVRSGAIRLVCSEVQPTTSVTDQGDIFLAEAMITNNGSLAITRGPLRINNDGTQTDQWCPAVTVKPGGTELFIGYYSRQEDPASNSWIRAYGAKGDVVNGLAKATFVCFPIGQTAFQPLFAGTNSLASMQYDPVYPADYPAEGFACWDAYARIACLPSGTNCGCSNTVYARFPNAHWFQDDNTWAEADSSYFYYAWSDHSATWTTVVLGTTNTTTRPDANVMLARILQ